MNTNRPRNGRKLPLVLYVFIVLLMAPPLFAALTDGALRVEIVTAYNLVVDSNAGTSPKSAYIGVTYHNDGSVPLTDLVAHVGNYNGGTGSTPGVYPKTFHATLVGPLSGGAFALTHAGGSAGVADATRYVATVPAHGSMTVYWLVSYPQKDQNGVPTCGPSIKPDDDLQLSYDVWATAKESGSTRTVSQSRTLTCRSTISSSSNKIYPNGANKVPDYYKALLNQYVPAWTNVFADGSVGSRITTEGVWYDLGNVGDGFDNNGDLIPDRNAWMQPVGNPDLFDAGAFRLVKTYAMVIVKLKTGGEEVLTGVDQLYFENIAPNNGAVGYVRYEFVPLVSTAHSITSPYQEVASGCNNEKFNADYGVLLGGEALVSGSANVLMDLTASVATVSPGGAIIYDVAYTNAGTVSAGDPDTGVPLVIRESIPTGTVYVAGSATTRDVLPSGVSGYHVLYSTDGGSTWLTGEPASAASVTDIQWWLDDPLLAKASGSVGFSVTASNPYTNSTPLVVDAASLSFGSGSPFANDTATTLVLGNNTASGSLFADTGVGSGGYFANGLKDGTEPGVSGVPVSLYADLDGDGTVDAGEPVVATTTTDATGSYQFSNLTDGYYVAVPNISGVASLVGYGLTTASTGAIDLDHTHASTSGLTKQVGSFGYAPALAVTKARTSASALREGQGATYALVVTNRLAGDGSGLGKPASYLIWPTNGAAGTSGNKVFLNPSNCWNANETDGQYATAPFNNASENMTVSGFYLGPQLGAITNVMIAIPMRVNGSFAGNNSTMDVTVYWNGTSIGTKQVSCSSLATGTYLSDITSYRTGWAWTNFNGSGLSVELLTTKKGSPGATIDLDSVGFKVTTDRTSGAASASSTLDPVPLDDVFDPSRLKYVSASPSPNGVTTNSGSSCTLHWNNLGPLYAGGAGVVTVNYTVLQPPNNSASTLTNTASVTSAMFLSGTPANAATSSVGDAVSPAATISGRVLRDLAPVGTQDTNDVGVAGVTVRLIPPAGVDAGNGINQPVDVVADSSGAYTFAALPASGTYTVAVVTSTLPGTTNTPSFDYDGLSAGSVNTAKVYVVYNSTTGADTVTNADFGYSMQSLIRGALWNDRDRSGTASRDSGEETLANVTVRLYASGSTNVLATATTGSDGIYRFAGAYSGSYVVRFDTSVGPFASGTWTESFDSDGLASANAVTFSNLRSGEFGTADGSYYQTGSYSVGGTLFYDWNGDGVASNGVDLGISGVTVRLYEDEATNGVVDAGVDALVATTVSGVNGTYSFGTLPSGAYLVVVEQAGQNFPTRYLVTCDPDASKDGRTTVVLTSNASSLNFGFQPYGFNAIRDLVWFDADANGAQSGFTEVGLSGVTVNLYAKIGSAGTYALIRSAASGSDGSSLFSALADGYYRVSVVTNSASLPTDAFNEPYRLTTDISRDFTLSGGSTNNLANFGFTALGAIGDTVFWDSNGNGGRDWNEPGIVGVRVLLYADANSNGVMDAGETCVRTTSTGTDGYYAFTGLVAGHYVAMVDGASAVLGGDRLTADPEMDGLPCPIPADGSKGCDGETAVSIQPGVSFMGADFGYQPKGVLGDRLWIDANTNGLCDAGEVGLKFVTVRLYGAGSGSLIATNVTDADGYYSFINVTDGTYNVSVDLADTDIPAGLAVSWDRDGTPDGTINGVKVGGGVVTAINNVQMATNVDLELDFAFRYVGSNVVSGTVGLDAPPYDGRLNGTNALGVGTGEYPFANVTVFLYYWNDNGDRVIASGETVLIGSSVTSTNGDYRFANLPSGGTNNHYIVALSAPADELRLTTTSGCNAAQWVHNTTNELGQTLSAYQVMSSLASLSDIDFAFESMAQRDFGDLPSSYSTTLSDQPVGPSHGIVAGQELYLGAGVFAEGNGKPSADASADSSDDGVWVTTQWREGAGGGSVNVKVGAGSGWLVGWVDFNRNGTFADTNELVFGQSVSSATNGGLYTIAFTVPAGTFLTNAPTVLNARFRLYPAKPTIATYFGPADAGEVEDYQFVFGVVGDRVWEDMNANGVQDAGEPGVSNVVVELRKPGAVLVQSVTSAADGSYVFSGLPTNTYSLAFGKPSGMIFTGRDQGGNDLQDSDADPTGSVTNIVLSSVSAARLDVDAGLYRLARVYGYIFKDTNGSLVRDAGDGVITNALVRLVSSSGAVAYTNSDEGGGYSFDNVRPGAVTVLVSRTESKLAAIPTDNPQASDPERNRGNPDAAGADAYVAFDVVSGYGSTEALVGETLNVGFNETTLSTALDVKLYTSANGTVSIEVRTVDESGYGDIVVYAWIGGAWVEVGRVPSSSVVGEGNNIYTVPANGLVAGQSYYLRIVDEAGHVHDSALPVSVASVAVESIRLSMQTAYVSFTTEPGSLYVVMVSDALSANPDAWTAEYVSVKVGNAWSDYSNEPFVAGEGTRTQVRVPINREKAFFKIVRILE